MLVKRQRWYETEIGKTVDTSTMTKEEINRQDAIYELIDSEADYVKDLQVNREDKKQGFLLLLLLFMP